MALIIIFLLGLGIYMEDFLAKDAANRFEIYKLHKSFGVIALFLISIRLVNRFINKAPELPQSIKRTDKNLAHITHILLYLLMIAMPISGYLMSNSYGYDVYLFSLKMPTLIAKNYELGAIFSKTHKYCGYFLILTISLHILGALKHRFFDAKENDVLQRMI